MFFNQFIKFAGISLVVLAAVGIEGYTITQIGDVTVKQADGKIYCDMLVCPPGTYRCFVSKSNVNPSVLERVDICYSQDNKTLAEQHSSMATNPENYIREYINAYSNGTVIVTSNNSQYSSNDKELANSLKKRLAEMQIEKNIENQMKNLKKVLGEIKFYLEHITN